MDIEKVQKNTPLLTVIVASLNQAQYLTDFINGFLWINKSSELSDYDYSKKLVTNFFNDPVPSQDWINLVQSWLKTGEYTRTSLFEAALKINTEELFQISLVGIDPVLNSTFTNPFG